MIIISIDGADTLVDEDYYKEGLAINQQFDKLSKAKEMGIVATIKFDAEKIYIELKSHQPINESLMLEFTHATIDARDFAVQLQQTTQGQYFALLPKNDFIQKQNKWYLNLTPYSKQWQLKASAILPTKTPLILSY